MTGQPPEGTERIYTGQYGGYAEQGQQYQADPFAADQYTSASPFGEQQYREAPQDFTLPGGPVSYDTTAYDGNAAPPDPSYVAFGATPGYPGQPGPGNPPGVDQSGFGQQNMGQPGMGQQGMPQPEAGQRHQGHAPRSRPNLGGGALRHLFSALSDTGFNAFVTPSIVSILYKITIVAFALAGLGLALFAFMASLMFGVITLFIIAPALFIVGVAFARVVLEFCLVAFRMADDLRTISGRDNA
ncbi:MAG: DUF4282 domain-containing protein [Streptosporangiaceae bacterium]|jgi:hypothetical protein